MIRTLSLNTLALLLSAPVLVVAHVASAANWTNNTPSNKKPASSTAVADAGGSKDVIVPAPAAAPAAKVAEPVVATENALVTPSAPGETPSEASQKYCKETIDKIVRPQNRARLQGFCAHVNQLQVCHSTEGRPIQHADSESNDARGKRILVLGMIHGDEPLSGEMALEWEERLQNIDHRNAWRVVPMLNPDGFKLKTRMNANGVDLNRNFPTKDWQEEATAYWKKSSRGDPRRFPGDVAASEAETKCVMTQIKDFRPDFIVSVHTPYHVLDFDGPKMPFPPYRDLPWRALGNYPGSLGRYMWKDYQIPVLTVELGLTMIDASRLQDIVGSFAIEASRRSGQKTAGIFEKMD